MSEAQKAAARGLTVPKHVNLFTAASHMHSHGVHYIARASDGQLLYETQDWAEPEVPVRESALCLRRQSRSETTALGQSFPAASYAGEIEGWRASASCLPSRAYRLSLAGQQRGLSAIA